MTLSSSRSYLISVLAAASSTSGFKLVAVSPSEVFKGPAAALPAAVFLSIVVGNFQCLFIFRGSSPCVSYILYVSF
jgi:hypothetical protein